uniref:Uncharacterized protein n=1 Tax=Nymphaea colorata TaxID=210225 RepID=A0A5K0VTH4_9MAGN
MVPERDMLVRSREATRPVEGSQATPAHRQTEVVEEGDHEASESWGSVKVDLMARRASASPSP